MEAHQSFHDYRTFVQRHYDGVAGALTSVSGWLTGHESLAGRVINPDAFDVRGCKHILDAGCGNGRYSKFILRHADPDARVTGFDLSQQMLKRASKRPGAERVSHVAADLTRLPYAENTFDAAVCGWVLEHLPQPEPGLESLARVLKPGGKLLLLTTEDSFSGRSCGKMWHCRTYTRPELREACAKIGLTWVRELWFSRFHAFFRLGGIIVELHKQARPA